MPRYVVERTFPEGLGIPAGREGAELCMDVVDRNAESGVTWVHSYVSADNARTFCVYDAPAPEAVRKTASRNDLPIDRITEVRVLDPYFRAARRLGSQRPGRSVAVLRPGEQASGSPIRTPAIPARSATRTATPLPPQPNRTQ